MMSEAPRGERPRQTLANARKWGQMGCAKGLLYRASHTPSRLQTLPKTFFFFKIKPPAHRVLPPRQTRNRAHHILQFWTLFRNQPPLVRSVIPRSPASTPPPSVAYSLADTSLFVPPPPTRQHLTMSEHEAGDSGASQTIPVQAGTFIKRLLAATCDSRAIRTTAVTAA